MRANLETELLWRQEELNFFKNQLNSIPDINKDRYRKSLVLILYSHMEGFIKIALLTYIQFINQLSIKRCDVKTGLMVAGMHKEFIAYENLDRKCKIFGRALPDDPNLHKLYRRVDFLESIDSFKDEVLIIEDQVIDTESNLWYIVLQKNLFKIGLPIDIFESHRDGIDALVNRRNSIAHGSSRGGVDNQEYSRWETIVLDIMSDVVRLLYTQTNTKAYLSTSS